MSIHIEGRRWFQKSYGNTYNTVRIYQDGTLAAELPEEYGYGDYFLQRAREWLGKHGHPTLLERYDNGLPKHSFTIYLREVLGGTYSVIDVPRERDL